MYIGVDLGGTTVKIAFVNQMGMILHKWEIATNLDNGGRNIVSDISTSIKAEVVKEEYQLTDFYGIGVGAPGPFNKEDGSVIEAVNLGWVHYPLKASFEKEINLPVFVDNDANVAAFGEQWQGAGAGTSDLVAITLGTGVGAGVICNGEIVNGKAGAGGEVGHIRILTEGGLPCNCGGSGCLETLVSATGLVRNTEIILKDYPVSSLKRHEKLSSYLIFQEAAKGDPAAEKAVDRFCYYLGIGLANIGTMLNPDAIVIGGGVSKAGEQLLAPTIKYFEEFAFTPVKNSTVISLAQLGNDAGVIGAAAMVSKHFLD